MSLSPTFFFIGRVDFWWELEVWLQDITCLCVHVDLGAVNLMPVQG